VGHRGLSQRLGRNHRYDSFGNAGTAGAMGVLGHYVAKPASFLFAAFLCVPLWLLPMRALSGIDAAVLGILSPLIIADVTAGSGRYTLRHAGQELIEELHGGDGEHASAVL
jgi:hypothetical protein